MTTEIKVWQIVNSRLELVQTSMVEAGRKKKILSEKDIDLEDLIINKFQGVEKAVSDSYTL